MVVIVKDEGSEGEGENEDRAEENYGRVGEWTMRGILLLICGRNALL